MPLTGVEKFHYAVLNKDDTTGYSYGEIKPIPNLAQIKISPKTSTAKFYADNRLVEQMEQLESVDVEVELADLPPLVRADWLGHKIDENGAIIESVDDQSKEIAIGFLGTKSNKSKRFVWLFKGKFEKSGDEYKTTEDKPKLEATKLKATFNGRIFDGNYKAILDEDMPGVNKTIFANWFAAVYNSSLDMAAPTVTTAPIDGAINVGANADVIWTFNKPIQESTISPASAFLMEVDGDIVNGELTIGEDKKTVTFNPAAALAVGQYIAVCTRNVKSIAGVPMTQNVITNFIVA